LSAYFGFSMRLKDFKELASIGQRIRLMMMKNII
jgi:hypothetical protein